MTQADDAVTGQKSSLTENAREADPSPRGGDSIMPQGPAARVGDPVAHPAPPVLGPGPGSVNVLIGNQPAWRGMPLAAAARADVGQDD